jgi:Family of unknown function (DUF6300)
MMWPSTPGPGAPGHPDIMLTRTAELPQCPRCGAEGLLSASVPDDGRNGERDGGRDSRRVVLCPSCDIADSAAGPLILFFAVYGQVTAQTAEEFAGLLRTWADHTAAGPCLPG